MDVTLTIDGKTATVRPGATVLEAARAAGADVPTLCQDDRLHPFGACRICMIEVEGPPRRLLPACTTPAAEGMSVATHTPAVIAARRAILELFLNNHPLDCPVCDKAGECRLQDLVHEYGLGPGLFFEEKRTSAPDYASPFLERNHNRCILCGKCVRVCSEQCGVGALTFSMRGQRTRISAALDKPLDCEFCGECLEICPVGALTAKQSKHKARPWNVENVRSTCIYCGMGCPILIERRDNRAVRVRAVNNHYLCAKGRFGWDAVLHESRLVLPKIRVRGSLLDCTWEEALSLVATNLAVIRDRLGADRIGGLGSIRTTNEDNYLFQKFMRAVVGTNNVDFLTRTRLPYGLNSIYFAEEISGLGRHDVILLLDTDAAEINAGTGIEIIRAVNRSGAGLIIAGGGQTKLSGLASVVIPHDREAVLESLGRNLRNSGKVVSSRIKRAVELLSSARSVGVVLPAQCSAATFRLVRDVAALLKHVSFYPLLMRGNIQGAMDMGMLPDYLPGYQAVDGKPASRGLNALEIKTATEHGLIAALYVMGDDPVGSDPAIAPVIRRPEFLVVQDIFMTETAKIADVVLPAASFMERSGTITTIERRLRRINAAIPALGESRPDWEIIAALAGRMGFPMNVASDLDIMKEIRENVLLYTNLAFDSRWSPELSPLYNSPAGLSLSDAAPRASVVLTRSRLLFSSGMMTTRSRELNSIVSGQDAG